MKTEQLKHKPKHPALKKYLETLNEDSLFPGIHAVYLSERKTGTLNIKIIFKCGRSIVFDRELKKDSNIHELIHEGMATTLKQLWRHESFTRPDSETFEQYLATYASNYIAPTLPNHVKSMDTFFSNAVENQYASSTKLTTL
jgi:hypothetical protein